jgi:hypothetical protein
MGIFDKFKTSTAIDRLSEEKLYEQVAQELKAGKKREGIWVKAMAKSGGDLNKAEALYIELRVQAIKDEASLAKAQNKLKEELEENQRSARKQREMESIKKLSQKKSRCINRLENLGYKITSHLNPETKIEIFKVTDTVPNINHSFDTLEEFCKFSKSASRSKTEKKREKKGCLIFVLILVVTIAVVASLK